MCWSRPCLCWRTSLKMRAISRWRSIWFRTHKTWSTRSYTTSRYATFSSSSSRISNTSARAAWRRSAWTSLTSGSSPRFSTSHRISGLNPSSSHSRTRLTLSLSQKLPSWSTWMRSWWVGPSTSKQMTTTSSTRFVSLSVFCLERKRWINSWGHISSSSITIARSSTTYS